MPKLSLSILGPFSAGLDGRPLAALRSAPVRALLVYLAVEGVGGRHQREVLTELLWPGMPPDSGRKNLRQTLYELRQAIPDLSLRGGQGVTPLVLADRHSIQINPDADWEVDAAIFENLIRQRTAGSLAAAVDLYRGDFLSDFTLSGSPAYEEWVVSRQAAYRDLALDALSRLARQAMDRADYEQGLALARRQLELSELYEPAHRQLMEALAGSGRRPEALDHYDRFRKLLMDEIGVGPAAATVEVYEAIVEGQLAPISSRPVEITTALPPERPGAPHNLPAQATAFIGREDELAEIRGLLVDDPDCRLLTLLGPGGSGKTRLAIEAAGRIAADHGQSFSDGIWFVPLDALSDPESAVSELATAVDFCLVAQDEPRRQLLDYFHNKRMLLVMDNYEHLLLDEQMPLAAEILSSAPRVKVLATSRARLNVHGERLMAVGGLALPPAGDSRLPISDSAAFSAIRLFRQGARQVRPDFEITPDNLPAVIQICRLVQGLPLGIELAAAWVELLAAEEIVDELAGSLDFLEAEWRDLPERQRSLRAVFEWSWRMLIDQEQDVVMALSIFRGGFSREAARVVAGASLKQLMALANKSWLARMGDGRLQMHALLRQLARQKLEMNEQAWRQVGDAHAGFYAGWLDGLKRQLRGPEQKEAFDLISHSFEDIRATWYRLVEGGSWDVLTEKMLPALLLAAAGRAGLANDLLAMFRAARQGIGRDADGSLPRAILDTAIAALAPGYYAPFDLRWWMINLPLPVEAIEGSWRGLAARAPGEVDGLWLVLTTLLYGWQVDREPAVAQLRRLVDYYRQGDDRWALAFALSGLGRLLSQLWFPSSNAFLSPAERQFWGETDPAGRQRWDQVRHLLSEANALWQELGDRLQQADTLRLLATHLQRPNQQDALTFFRQARHLYEALGDLASVAEVLTDLSVNSIYAGEYEQAFTALGEVRAIYEWLGNRRYLGYTLSDESRAALRYGDLDYARETRERSLAIARELEEDQQIGWCLWELGDIVRVSGELAEARRLYRQALPYFDRAKDEVGRCFYHKGLGDVALLEGDYRAAREFFEQALVHAAAARHDWSTVYCRCGLARALMAGSHDDAAREQLVEALRVARLAGFRDLVPLVLTGLAQWWASAGDPGRAVTLATFTANHIAIWQETRKWAVAVADKAAGELSVEAYEAAVAQSRTLDVPAAVILAK